MKASVCKKTFSGVSKDPTLINSSAVVLNKEKIECILKIFENRIKFLVDTHKSTIQPIEKLPEIELFLKECQKVGVKAFHQFIYNPFKESKRDLQPFLKRKVSFQDLIEFSHFINFKRCKEYDRYFNLFSILLEKVDFGEVKEKLSTDIRFSIDRLFVLLDTCGDHVKLFSRDGLLFSP